ncbi:MAG: hypothetical protein J6J24_02090 [Clostridia bacterium]|nr:hypothetical protein [Clostridia bacterium]
MNNSNLKAIALKVAAENAGKVIVAPEAVDNTRVIDVVPMMPAFDRSKATAKINEFGEIIR